MPKVQMSRGKWQGIQVCANEQGIIAAVAMDQRSSLRKSMNSVRAESATDEALMIFKKLVAQTLTREASAILLDPEYGLPAMEARAADTGVLLSYEMTGYDAAVKGRLPNLLPRWSVRRLVEAGTQGVKILLYYNPYDDERICDIKRAFVERVGDECRVLDVPFFLELLAYDDLYDAKGVEFARLKPKYSRIMLEEFSQSRYGVDVFKVEIPINMAYLAGSRAFQGGEAAYDRKEALDHFRACAAVTNKPLIYLSGGVDDAVFRDALELAAEAYVPFCGVLCGRATWKGGIPVFVKEGPAALEQWLRDQGIQHVRTLNETLAYCARPWTYIYGGLDNIEISG